MRPIAPSVLLLASLSGFAALAGCRAPETPAVSGRTARDSSSSAAVQVHEQIARPRVAVLARQGDPRAAVAVTVQTEGGAAAAVSLAAIVETRLLRAGIAFADSRADADGFSVRALVEAPEEAAIFVRAVHDALFAKIESGNAELAAASRRLVALRRRTFAGPLLSAIARCTGELGVEAGEALPDPATGEGAVKLEAWRAAFHVSDRVAFAAVGPGAVGERMVEAVAKLSDWPPGNSAEEEGHSEEEGYSGDPWPKGDVAFAYASPELGPSASRLTLALRTADPWAAAFAARLAGDPEGPLATRLRSLPFPFRLIRVAATAKFRGGCLTLEMQPAGSVPPGDVEEAASNAAALARLELLDELGSASAELATVPSWRPVVAATDPREAAALAGRWSLAHRARGRRAASAGERVASALGLPPLRTDPHEPDAEIPPRLAQSGARFADLLARADRAWSAPVSDRRVRIERGQGEMWLLLGSPCGTAAEGEADAGTTALAVSAAVADRPPDERGVAIEPWITPDGVGVLAHAPRLPGESGAAQAARIAERAARIFTGTSPAPAAFASARGTLLRAAGSDVDPAGAAAMAAASALTASHPSWILPLGSLDSIARGGAEASSLRWAALLAGPIRVAILANDDAAQGDAALRTIDHWMIRRSDSARSCPAAVTEAGPPMFGTLAIVEPPGGAFDHALIALPAPPTGSDDFALAELLVLGLNGADGILAKALAAAAPGSSATAALLGGSRKAALMIELRAPTNAMDPLAAQVRGTLDRLRQGALSAGDLARSLAQHQALELEKSFDPRRRIVDLFRDAPVDSHRTPTAARPNPSLDAWRTWASTALRDDRMVVVSARTKR